MEFFLNCLSLISQTASRRFVLRMSVSEAGTLKYKVPENSIHGHILSGSFSLYVNDFPQSLSEDSSYLYVLDTCIFSQHENVKKNVLHKCILYKFFRHYVSSSQTMSRQFFLVV